MMHLFSRLSLAVLGAGLSLSAVAHAQSGEAGRAAFRDIYKELVETDSSPTTGSCTTLVRKVETRLKSAGYGASDYEVVIPEGKPDDGNLVAWIKGKDTKKKGVLLLAHIDVVDAKRADWEREPFKLFEENGFFYGRGTADMKGQAAVWIDMMIRFKQDKAFKPSRTVKMALTCGEETSNRVNGVDYLLKTRRELIDADFALNEGGGGTLDSKGKVLSIDVQAGEKMHQVVTLELTNPGGHSSRPVPDNAIYRLASALKKIEAYAFPIILTPVNRAYFERMGPLTEGDLGRAMSAYAKDPNDAAAQKALLADPTMNGKLHTTCVATQLDAGHAPNALPQRARAILSCRVMQGTTIKQVTDALSTAIDDKDVKVFVERPREGSSPPELTKEIMVPIEAQVKKMWPGTPVIPNMSAGATDGRFLMNAGIPTYGVSGMMSEMGETNAHGLNEKLRVKSLYEGRDFLEAITRGYVK